MAAPSTAAMTETTDGAAERPTTRTDGRGPKLAASVIYRNRDGADVAAIITEVGVDGYVLLEQFPPPGHAKDFPNNRYQGGVPQWTDEGEPEPRTWRWPDWE